MKQDNALTGWHWTIFGIFQNSFFVCGLQAREFYSGERGASQGLVEEGELDGLLLLSIFFVIVINIVFCRYQYLFVIVILQFFPPLSTCSVQQVLSFLTLLSSSPPFFFFDQNLCNLHQVSPLPWAKKVTLLFAEPDIPYCDGENWLKLFNIVNSESSKNSTVINALPKAQFFYASH